MHGRKNVEVGWKFALIWWIVVLGLTVILTAIAMLAGGCEPYTSEWRLGREAHEEERLPMLKDGRVHIGMSQYEFARLWDRPPEINIDRWTDSLGISETWKFDWSCEVSSWHYARYVFHFDNGILTFWSEN